MTQGIILAGGLSSRAHTNKLMLEINGKPLICYAVDGMRPFVDEIIVVTGKYHNEMLPILKDVKVIQNKNFKRGMFSSILEGVKNVSSDFFVLPGDTPFVSKNVYKTLLNGSFSIRVPACNGQTGHPVFFRKEHIEKILSESVDSNLREYIAKNEIEKMEVSDSNCLIDIDTIDDFNKFIKTLERNKHES